MKEKSLPLFCAEFSRKKLFRPVLAAVLLLCAGAAFAQTSAPRPTGRPSVALVLSGGGARGFAHIPVLELIEELDIPIDMVIGNSIGAIIGGLYCAGYTPSEIRALVAETDWVPVFQDRPGYPLEDSLKSHSVNAMPINLKFGTNLMPDLGQGFSSGEQAYKLIKSLTAKIPSYIDFDTLPIPFRAVAVDMGTGDLEVFGNGDLAEAIRASMSIPAVFEPFVIDGKSYMDGGVKNNAPIQQAKDLGYDILIVVDLYGEKYAETVNASASSTMYIPQLFNMYMSTDEKLLEMTDLVLNPDLSGISMFDFPKAMEIYNRGVESKEKFRAPLQEVRKKIYPQAQAVETPDAEGAGGEKTSIRFVRGFRVIEEGVLAPEREGAYADLEEISLETLSIQGAVASDEPYIIEEFEKNIQGRPLTREALAAFIDEVYGTGNYNFVITRTDFRYGREEINLILRARNPRATMLLLGVDYQSTLSSDTINKLSISADLQFRGITGPGSVLAVSLGFVNKTTAELIFMQPFNPRVYTQISGNFLLDQDFISSGFSNQALMGNRILTAGADMSIGISFNPHHSLVVGPSFVWMNADEGYTTDLSYYEEVDLGPRVTVAIPFTLEYTFNNLDYLMLPMSGFYVKLTEKAVFPIAAEELPGAYNLFSVDFSALIPLESRFSLETSAFIGTEVTRNLLKIPYQIPVFGFNSFDRKYFPQVGGKRAYGSHKGVAQVALLFQPWDNVTILGGQLIFSAAASAGIIALDYADFSTDGLFWNMAFGAGVRINKVYGIQLRLGVGAMALTVMPFLSLDIGALRF